MMKMFLLSNPWRVMIMTACVNAMFFIPIVIAYYNLKGVDLGGFLLLQGIFRIAVMILEIPTGYLADRWSRTSQIRLGSGLWLLSMIVLFYSTSFGGILFSEMVAALACALRSGTVEAYLHEALKAEGKLHEQAKWQSRNFSAVLIAEMFAGVLGGWLFSYWIEAPVVATIGFAVLGLMVAYSLPNLPREAVVRRHTNHFTDLWLVVHYSLRQHPQLPWLLVGPSTLFGLTGVLFWLFPAKLLALGTTPLMLGLATTGYFAVKALLALNGAYFQRFSHQTLVAAALLSLVLGVGLMLTTSAWLVWLGGVFSAGVVHAIGKPLSTTLINTEVPDHERATVLSVASMFNQLVGAGLMIGAEPLLNFLSLESLIMAYLGITLALAGYPLWRLAKA